MDFKDIASVSGKGGLFKVVKPAKTGIILESLDKDKKKLVAGLQNNKVSILDEISIYTTSEEGAVPLRNVMTKIYEDFGDDLDVDTTSGEELKSFTKHIVPDYDEERVYVSDMKKLVNWYRILVSEAPDIFKPAKSDEKADGKKAKSEPEATKKTTTKKKSDPKKSGKNPSSKS